MHHPASLKVLFQAIVFTAFIFRWFASGQECGQRKIKFIGRVLGGERASSEKWPWHATITHRNHMRLEVVCGGSIIDKYTILTAAHCLYTEHGLITADRVVVHVGRSQLSANDLHTKIYIAYKLLIHPGHNHNSVTDDIALISLWNEIELSDYVQPVCICPAEDDTELVGRNGTVIGFGLNVNDTISDHLMEAEVPVVDRWDCLESNREVFGKHLTRKMLCGGTRKGVGPCNGDSGGGYVFPIGDAWCVRGIVSFAPELNHTTKCDPQEYAVYTDVAKYHEWLKRNTNAMFYSNVRPFSVTTRQCQEDESTRVRSTESGQTACGLWKDEGPCFDFTMKMFFDVKYGDCRLFVYGGCEGNNNRFDTESECKSTCITPVGKDICLLPKSEGHCTRTVRRWYYNSDLKVCEQFIYGGCKGNSNRFESLEDCRALCS